MDQTLVNWLLSGFGTLLGLFISAIWGAVKDLHAADAELVKKISGLEVLVAGDYVRRDAFDDSINRVFAKLERIENKIDHKADK